jgi:hypothetical protein
VQVSKRPIESNSYCKHVHISERTRTEGTPYLKGWCSKCGSWVFTEKTFCICCRKRVKHKVHHRHTKQVLDNAILMNKELIDEYRIMPYSKQIWVETEWKGRRYMIPIKYLVLWEDHPNKNEIMDMVLDEITTVRN